MVLDFKLTSDYDITLDDTNDFATVEGDDAKAQSIVCDVLNATGTTHGSRDTATNRARVKADVRSELQTNPHVDDVVSISIDEFDPEVNELSVSLVVDPIGTISI